MFTIRCVAAVCVVALLIIPDVASFQCQQAQRAGDIPAVETVSVSPQLHVAEGSLMHISSHGQHHLVSAAQSRLFRRQPARTSRHLVTLSMSSAPAATASIVHPSSHSAYDNKENDKHEYIGTKYLLISGNPVMEKIDQIERDMGKNQAEAHEMIEALRNDLKIQRILRHESEMAMDRLKEIKTDMVMRLNQMREHCEDDRRALIRESNRQLALRDEKVEAYEKELGSLRCLAKRLVSVLISKFLGLGEKLTRRFANEKAAATHALLE